jgi:uncharacterized protein (DUF1684 family)
VLVAGAWLPGAGGCGAPSSRTDAAYEKEIEGWREQRDQRLRSEAGWLTLVGLFWLDAGENPFGSAPGIAVALPEGRGPGVAGSFVLEGGRVRVRAEAAAGVTLNGEPVTERELATDAGDEPDVLVLDDLRMHVIERGGRFAIRVRDPRSPVRASFTGLEYFPVDPAYRVEATFVPYDPPREIEIATVLGTVEPMRVPGRAEFTLRGRRHALEPVLETPDAEQLFFIFRDETSGRETYGAGRYLYADRPTGGRLTLDFNKAYNPPCVFTPYATCPLPPRSNWLKARIEAGEKAYRHAPGD